MHDLNNQPIEQDKTEKELIADRLQQYEDDLNSEEFLVMDYADRLKLTQQRDALMVYYNML